jgi:hypothetical protein
LQILEDLGGLAELQVRDGRQYVQGFGCLVSQVVTQYPKVCLLAQVLVS